MGLRFLADHCIPNSVIQALRESGHEVFQLRDYIPIDSSDQLVLSTAQKLNSILLSLNGDFTNRIMYPPANSKGIVAFQVKNHPEIIPQLVTRLESYLSVHPDMDSHKGKLILVESHRIRVRQ